MGGLKSGPIKSIYNQYFESKFIKKIDIFFYYTNFGGPHYHCPTVQKLKDIQHKKSLYSHSPIKYVEW